MSTGHDLGSQWKQTLGYICKGFCRLCQHMWEDAQCDFEARSLCKSLIMYSMS